MLRELSVQNLAIIQDVRVELEEGFCAWTGETGAGKTLLLTALGLLLGDRGSGDVISHGAEELRITGVFDLTSSPLLPAIQTILDMELTDPLITVMRKLTLSGRSFAYFNEQPISITTLKKIGALLVDIHGQRESESLLDPAFQLQQLDAFGQLTSLVEAYQAECSALRSLREKYFQLQERQHQRQRELSLMEFEKEELGKANLLLGEKEMLRQERERLIHGLGVQTFLQNGSNQLYDEEGSVYEMIGKLQREAERWSTLDPRLQEIFQRLTNLGAETRDMAESMRDLAQNWQINPERSEEVESRLQQILKLETKYGKSTEELIAYRDSLDATYESLLQEEVDVSGLHSAITNRWNSVLQAGSKLSSSRAKVAKKLASEVQKHLADLGMKEAKLESALIPITPGDDPLKSTIPASGFEQLEFQLAANKGESARPLRKVASGGELSRTMLALKSVLAAQENVGTLVFDEIDANVGGRLGDVLGQKLARLGKTHQIICVTHLPQVASYARYQWTIRKEKQGKRTVTSIKFLDEKDRVDELASMLRGEAKGETTRKEAEAMLSSAKKAW